MKPRTVGITVALRPYDITEPIREVGIAGTTVAHVAMSQPLTVQEALVSSADVFEVGLGEYADYRARGGRELIALPVFPSRRFVHRSILVRGDRAGAVADLKGRRVVADPWPATTPAWVRVLLADGYGLDPDELTWVPTPAGASPTGRGVSSADADAGEVFLRTLHEVVAAEDADAVVVEGRLAARLRADGSWRPLFAEPGAVERQDLRRLGVFPIHDVVAMRRELVERERWLATNVYRALEIARRRYVYRLTDIRASRLPIPSVAGYALSLREFFGPDLWSYGLAANRATLQAFLDRTTAASDHTPVDSLFYPVEPFVDGM